jgi:hypothetical protein
MSLRLSTGKYCYLKNSIQTSINGLSGQNIGFSTPCISLKAISLKILMAQHFN